MPQGDPTLLADGLEDGFIGYFWRCGKPMVACYDFEKCVRSLMKRDGMSYEGAVEYLEFNSEGAWVGEGTPAFLHRCDLQAFKDMCQEDEPCQKKTRRRSRKPSRKSSSTRRRKT